MITKPITTVHELRKKGYKVKIIHLREHVKDKSVHHRSSVPLFHRKDFEKPSDIWVKGGKTVLGLRTPDGKEFEETVRCHRKDNFSRKAAIDLALLRISKKNNLSSP